MCRLMEGAHIFVLVMIWWFAKYSIIIWKIAEDIFEFLTLVKTEMEICISIIAGYVHRSGNFVCRV